MTHEQCLHYSTARVQGGKGAKNHRRACEPWSVQLNTKQFINGRQPRWRTRHRIVCGCKPIFLLIPRRRTWEYQLYCDANQVHPTITLSKHRHRTRCTEYEHDNGAHCRCTIVNDSVRQPSHYAQKSAGMGGENVAQIRTVEYVFEGRENSDPDGRSPGTRDKSVSKSLLEKISSRYPQSWSQFGQRGERGAIAYPHA